MKTTNGLRSGLAALLVLGSAVLLTMPNRAGAQDGTPAPSVRVEPVYESEKGWSFDDNDNLVFYNPSPNPGGARYFRWKDYTWMVTGETIIVTDLRPYGTTLQGRRGLMTKDGRQSDKDLMNDLKKQAGNVRSSQEPSTGLPVSIGLGFGFDFGRRSGHYRHH
jgi:hypothetical protein